MKSFAAFALSLLAVGVSAQYSIGSNGTIDCAKAGTYCAGDSGATNIIIHCESTTNSSLNYAGNCNDNLAGLCGGVCVFAPCYQSSPSAGDGQCSICGGTNATGYPITTASGCASLTSATPSSSSSSSTKKSSSTVVSAYPTASHYGCHWEHGEKKGWEKHCTKTW